MNNAVEYLIVLLMGLAPISEVRGAIPLARVLFPSNGEFVLASIIAVLGNLAVAPAVLWVLKYLEKVMVRRIKLLEKVYWRVLGLAHRKTKNVEKYGLLGLTVFVAIPLPATGAWTGSLVAYLLGLPKAKSLLAIETGVLIASLIVYAAVVLGLEIIKNLFLI